MVFSRVLSTFKVGGPSVRTVPHTATVRPGGRLAGHVELVGAGRAVEIPSVTVAVTVSSAAREFDGGGAVTIADVVIGGPVRIGAKESTSFPFSVDIPYDVPSTIVDGPRRGGAVVDVRTTVQGGGGRANTHSEVVDVELLPSQQCVLHALLGLGFTFKGEEFTSGSPFRPGRAALPVQRMVFYAAPRYAHECRDVSVGFQLSSDRTEAVLDVDRHSTPFGPAGGTAERLVIDSTHTDSDIADAVDAWVARAMEKHRARNPQPVTAGAAFDAADSPTEPSTVDARSARFDDAEGRLDRGNEQRRGGGGSLLGGLATGAAGGLLGGMLAQNMFGDDDDDDGDES